jgi:hypothetical protein
MVGLKKQRNSVPFFEFACRRTLGGSIDPHAPLHADGHSCAMASARPENDRLMQAFRRIVALNGSLIKIARGYYRHSFNKPEPALSESRRLIKHIRENPWGLPSEEPHEQGLCAYTSTFPDASQLVFH